MNIQTKRLPRSQVELIIEVGLPELKPFLSMAATQIASENAFHGFRPGKAPYHIVKDKLGEIKIYEKALEPCVTKTFIDAVRQESLEPVGPPKVEVQKMAPGNPLVYKATVALLPKIKLCNWRKVSVKKKKVEIGDKEVDKAIDNLRKSRAKEAAVDRPARRGDKVKIDLEMFLGKVPIEGGQTKNHTIQLGESHFIPGLSEKLEMISRGETREFILNFPKDHYDKKLAGKPVEFRVKANEIFQVDLPELTDEFAKSLGKFDNKEDLKKKIEDNLIQEAEERERARAEQEILEQLCKKSDFGEIPEVLIGAELDKMIAELKFQVESQGAKFADYLKQLNKKEVDLREGMREGALKRIKTALLIREVARAENIEVDESEVGKQIAELERQYQGINEILKRIRSQDYCDQLKTILLNQKVIKFLSNQIIH